jgi:hypothetical protein
MSAASVAKVFALLGLFSCGLCAAACPWSAMPHERLWAGVMADWSRLDSGAQYQFGALNLSPGLTGLRAIYPKGSYDPAAARNAGAPLGGAQFRTAFNGMGLASSSEVGLRFQVLLQDNFQFVRGGKLPGLYGGTANTGGRVPTGYDGFSVRFVWQAQGDGALSAYLPTSGKWGTVLGLGHWRFVPGRSTDLTLYLKMNTPGVANGVIAAWADDVMVVYASDVLFRNTSELTVDGFFFSTFFGGSTPDWATPVDTASHFGPMEVFTMNPAALGRCAADDARLRARSEVR